jgi:hypothetical protein
VTLPYSEKNLHRDLLKVNITGPSAQVDCDITWREKYVECKFVPTEAGEYQPQV